MAAAARVAPAVRPVIPQVLRTNLVPDPAPIAARLAPVPVANRLAEFAKRAQNPITLRQMHEFGANPTPETLLTSAKFLHGELPIRLAHRVHELAHLPYFLCDMPSVVKVRKMYEQSFVEMLDSPAPQTAREEEDFSKLIKAIMDRHNDVVKLVARGVLELKNHNGKTPADWRIQSFLDRFYMSRISIRMLITQHLGIREPREGYAGIINLNCKPSVVARHVADDVHGLAYRHYGDCPSIRIVDDRGITLPYVEGHLYFMLFEVLKNAVRATLETHSEKAILPEVRVVIVGGSEDITIKVSDEGGGIPRSAMNKIWTYLFTTAEIPPTRLLEMEESNGRLGLDPMAGFGYGLPLSRLYARYFGGNLTLMSMEGYGTDAFMYLCKVGDKEEAIK